MPENETSIFYTIGQHLPRVSFFLYFNAGLIDENIVYWNHFNNRGLFTFSNLVLTILSRSYFYVTSLCIDRFLVSMDRTFNQPILIQEVDLFSNVLLPFSHSLIVISDIVNEADPHAVTGWWLSC